jgi:phage gpG-like protein
MNPTPIASAVIADLQAKLNAPENILEAIGGMLVSASKDAFDKQAFGDIPWAARYPNQQAPKVNVAGVVADVNAGGQPKARRFVDRPALIDSGNLRKGISYSIEGTTVIESASEPYAQRAHAGGESTQFMSQTGRTQLARFLRQRPEYRPRLGFLFNVFALTTNSVPRPFMGMTDETEVKIVRMLEDWLGLKAETT